MSHAGAGGAAARDGELIDASFAIQRGLLYDALGRPRSTKDGKTERQW
jgi:hypothetical protein